MNMYMYYSPMSPGQVTEYFHQLQNMFSDPLVRNTLSPVQITNILNSVAMTEFDLFLNFT